MTSKRKYWNIAKQFLSKGARALRSGGKKRDVLATPYLQALDVLVKNPKEKQALCAKVRSGEIEPTDFAKLVSLSIDSERIIPGPADSLLDELCRIDSVSEEDYERESGDVFYMPTQVRQIEQTISAGYISSEDYFIDVGCGPGARIAIYVHLRTGAYALGIEKYERYFEHASAVIKELHLDSVRVVKADALRFDYSAGNVFLLFRPVEGRKQIALLKKILHDTRPHPVTILASGGIERTLESDPRLSFVETLSPADISVFRSAGREDT